MSKHNSIVRSFGDIKEIHRRRRFLNRMHDKYERKVHGYE